MGFFNKTIIPLALVGYEMIITNSHLFRHVITVNVVTRCV